MLRLCPGILVLLALGCARETAPAPRPAPPRRTAFGEPVRAFASRVGPVSGRPAVHGSRLAATRAEARPTDGAVVEAVILTEFGGGTESVVGIGKNPAWSPDGKWMALSSRHDGTGDIYVVPAAGGAWTRITSDPGDEDEPAWSPDGTCLAFTSVGEPNRIWILNRQTGARTFAAQGRKPAWSPDGKWIAFEDGRVRAVFKVRPDGTGRERLSNDREAGEPSWSPDGRWIACTTFVADGFPDDLWAVSPDGKRKVRLTWDPAPEESPFWAPDGRIWFVSDTGRTSGPFEEAQPEILVISPEHPELLR